MPPLPSYKPIWTTRGTCAGYRAHKDNGGAVDVAGGRLADWRPKGDRDPIRVKARAEAIAWRCKEMHKLLPRAFRPRALLDIGCGAGRLTAALGKSYGLDAMNVYGCDVRAFDVKDFQV